MASTVNNPLFDTCVSYGQLGLSAYLPKAVTHAFEHTQANAVHGDYYEFGLYAGCVFHHAQQEASRLGMTDMRFWGFDSFQGLPEVLASDHAVGFNTGDYSCSRDIVEKLLNRFGVDWSRVQLIEGWYNESLTDTLATERGMGPAAVVNVDCDIYISTVPVLKFIEPLLQSGTVIIFDDWNCFRDTNDGEKRAFGEFLAAHPEWTTEDLPSVDWCDRSFVMRKRL